MKRFIFSAIALAVMTTACTESGLIDTPAFYANEISFDPYIGNTPVTKAESIDLDYLKAAEPAFHVYAYLHDPNVQASDVNVSKPFMDKDVWFDDNKGIWVYDGLEYWPNSLLAFVAYNSDADKCITKHATETEFEFTVKDVVEDQVDLLVTPFLLNQQDTETGNANVNLVFKHLLSRIGFSVVATNKTEDVRIAIRSIKLFGDFPSVGTVDLTQTKTVTMSSSETDTRPYITPKEGTLVKSYSLFDSEHCFEASSTDCTSTNELPGKPIFPNAELNMTETDWSERYKQMKDAVDKNRYMMIIPCNPGDNAYIEVEYQLTSDIKRTAKVPLKNWTFKEGFAYEFVLKVTTSSIEFSAEMGGWTGNTATAGPLIPLS